MATLDADTINNLTFEEGCSADSRVDTLAWDVLYEGLNSGIAETGPALAYLDTQIAAIEAMKVRHTLKGLLKSANEGNVVQNSVYWVAERTRMQNGSRKSKIEAIDAHLDEMLKTLKSVRERLAQLDSEGQVA